MMREVRDIKWVRALAKRPECIPEGHPRGAKREGVKYEGALAGLQGFAVALHGQWFEFADASGHGFAQADFVFQGDVVVVVEAKLTWTPSAYVQLRKLYLPLLRGLGCKVGGVVVCQNLTRETPKGEVVGDINEALRVARASPGGVIPTLHLPLLGAQAKRLAKVPPGLPSWWRKGQLVLAEI